MTTHSPKSRYQWDGESIVHLKCGYHYTRLPKNTIIWIFTAAQPSSFLHPSVVFYQKQRLLNTFFMLAEERKKWCSVNTNVAYYTSILSSDFSQHKILSGISSFLPYYMKACKYKYDFIVAGHIHAFCAGRLSLAAVCRNSIPSVYHSMANSCYESVWPRVTHLE